MFILSLQDLLQNQSLETVPICTVFRIVSHRTILAVFTCTMNVRDQTRQAFVTIFCRSLTIEYQFSQYELNTYISEQFVSTLFV